MAVTLNHTIVAARDKNVSAKFLAGLFGLSEPQSAAHFVAVELANGVTLLYDDVPGGTAVHPQHYAFLISEDEFDEIYGRISTRGLAHWADPRHERPDEINRRNDGRGVYFSDPAGHNMEILTKP